MRLRNTAFRLVAVLLSASAVAQIKPNFSGDYVLNKEKSQLVQQQAANLEKATLTIQHQGNSFKFNRVFTVKGKEEPFSYQLVIDGSEVQSDQGAIRNFSRILWESNTLVYQVRMVAPQGEATNVVRYTLEQDGRVLRAEEVFRGPRLSYRNVWIFERKIQSPS